MNEPQKYIDIVEEVCTMAHTSKSNERNLVYFLSIGGLVLYSIFYTYMKLSDKDQPNCECDMNSSSDNNIDNIQMRQRAHELLWVVLIMSVFLLLVTGNIPRVLIGALVTAVVLYFRGKENILPGISIFILGVYAYTGLYRLYVFMGGEKGGNMMEAIYFACALALIPIGKKAILRAGLLANIVIPFSLLIYVLNKYATSTGIMVVDAPTAVRLVIGVIIFVFVANAIHRAVKTWDDVSDIKQVICLGSCITIMAINRFGGSGAIMSADLHHPIENVIAYSQMVELGQSPFSTYIPVSGMYSIVQGAIFAWFGNGEFANYFVTENMFYLLVIIPIIWLLSKHVNGEQLLLISVLFPVMTYNRCVFILPIVLLLTWKKLLAQHNKWLMAWFITSLFHGLYYPLYGAAVCLGFLPMAVWQIRGYVVSGAWKQDKRSGCFWAGWLICIAMVIACIGLLFGTLRHMLAMSSQSIVADGISRFGQTIPEWFFKVFGNTHPFFRLATYSIATFLPLALVVWGFYVLALHCGQVAIIKKKLRIKKPYTFLGIIAGVIMPLVCYTFTPIRLDVHSIYARSAGIMYVSMVLFMLIAYKYLISRKSRMMVLALALLIPSLVNDCGLSHPGGRLFPHYGVPQNYEYVHGSSVKKLGTGFVESKTYKWISDENKRLENADRSISYFGEPNIFGLFYLLDIKGAATMESYTAKCYSAAQEAVDIVRANHGSVGRQLDSLGNYYLYYYFMVSGEYCFDEDKKLFAPNDGRFTQDDIYSKHKELELSGKNRYLGKIPNSWGLSMKDMEPVFTEIYPDYSVYQNDGILNINFAVPLAGQDADFIYIDFGKMAEKYNYVLHDSKGVYPQGTYRLANKLMLKDYNPGMRLVIRWWDDNNQEQSLSATVGEGKLLIPLGSGCKWLLNNHSKISIKLLQDNQEIAVPEINCIRFLKVREVK